jgi:thiopeptide-type bacteriocin biosynthesis protein
MKLYGPASAADRLLTGQVEPVLHQFLESGAADRWFFIRYMDPEPHLRLRVRVIGSRGLLEVRPALEALAGALHRDGGIWRIQWDTYEREVERYGGPEGIEIAERVFHADSEAVVEILGMLWGDAGLDARWRLALRGMDRLLDDVELDDRSKLQLMRRAARGFRREFQDEKQLHVELGDKLRRERRALEVLLDSTKDAQSDLLPGLEVLHRRSARLRPLLRELRRWEREGKLDAPVTNIVMSYVHMFANRLLRSAARAHELVLYDFLSRLYESRLAQADKERSAPRKHRGVVDAACPADVESLRD